MTCLQSDVYRVHFVFFVFVLLCPLAMCGFGAVCTRATFDKGVFTCKKKTKNQKRGKTSAFVLTAAGKRRDPDAHLWARSLRLLSFVILVTEKPDRWPDQPVSPSTGGILSDLKMTLHA